MRIAEDGATSREVDAFYQRVHEIMVNRGLDWTDLSRKMGMNESSFTSMREERRVPSVLMMRRIADALGVSFDELFSCNGLRDSERMYFASPSMFPSGEDLSNPCFCIREMAYYMVDENEGDALDGDVVLVEKIQDDPDDAQD